MNCFIPNEYVKCLAWKAALLSNKGTEWLTHYRDVCGVDTQVNRSRFWFNSQTLRLMGDDSWKKITIRSTIKALKQINEWWTKEFIQLLAEIKQFAKKKGEKKSLTSYWSPARSSVLWVICNAACMMSLLVCPSLWVMTSTVWQLHWKSREGLIQDFRAWNAIRLESLAHATSLKVPARHQRQFSAQSSWDIERNPIVFVYE